MDAFSLLRRACVAAKRERRYFGDRRVTVNEKDTLVDNWLRRLKNRPVIAVLVVGGLAIIAVAQLFQSLSSIENFLSQKPKETTSSDVRAELARSKLLARGIEPSSQSLREAISSGDLAVVGLLLGAGISPNGTGDKADTPLLLAIQKNSVGSVRLLLEAGANPNAPLDSRKCSSPLTTSIKNLELLDVLISWNGPNKLSVRPLCSPLVNEAAASGNLPVVQKLLSAGLSYYGERDIRSDGATPLMSAVATSQYERMQKREGNLLTPERIAVAEFFLKSGKALVNERDRDGQTALFLAVESRSIDAVRLLLSHGADRTIPDGAGVTPLQMARPEIAKVLQP
jgi:ankyrin repeat protein